jgi:endonuclease I/methionine-rich copper-binding protein CopC
VAEVWGRGGGVQARATRTLATGSMLRTHMRVSRGAARLHGYSTTQCRNAGENLMPMNPSRVLCALGLLLASGIACAQIDITSGSPALQNFDTLANTGTTNTTLPTGWQLAEPGSNGQYVASDGSGAGLSGSVYSFGTTGSSERALGTVASGSTSPIIGAQLRNATGSVLSGLRVAFTMEQWRLGATGSADRLAFAYSTDATSVTTGTWTPVPQLDAIAIVTAGTAESALDGNAAANRAAVTFDIGGLSLATNATIWIRWSDFNDGGADDGIAIDEVSIGLPVDNPPTVASSDPAHNDTDVAFDTAITITFSESVDATGNWFTFNCGAGTPTLTPSASPATTFTLTPSAPIGYSKLCTLTVIAAQISDRDSPIDVMEFDEQIQFETEADDPPFVVATVPDDNQANVARAADLLVTFSEPVNAPASAFGIFCPDNAVTTLPFALSSDDDTNFVLNPTNDLPAGIACRLYVDNLQVTDQDAIAQNPDVDTRINFTTAALAPPAVISTFPTDNATNFPSAGDLQATFDTSVTLSPGAFTLSCVQSTGISLSHPMSGSSFVIDTGTALVPGDACTFTIVAANVISGDGLNPAQNEVVTFTVFDSASTDAYYQNVNLSSDAQLLCSLYDTINGHTKLSYSYTVLNLADEDPTDSSKILDVYKNASYTKYTSGDATHNREHTWPRTYGLGETSSPGSATDYHMLHLTDTAYNSDRGSKPLGDCDNGCVQRTTIVNQGQGGSGNAQSNWYSTTGSAANNPLACPSQGNTENCKTYEVWDWRKGDIARAVMYMAIRYKGEGGEANLELTDDRTLITSGGSGGKHYMGLLSHILAWNQSDPPTEAERDRNQIVQSFQNNRNPFTDHPEWARPGVFTASLTSPCILNTQAPAANDDSYSTPPNTVLTVAADDGVLDNDLDAEGAPLSAELVATVSSGTLALAANGGFTYTPASGFSGSTSFTYRASDGVRLSAARTVTIVIGTPVDIFGDGFEEN